MLKISSSSLLSTLGRMVMVRGRTISSVTVIGGGAMGSGIAQVAAAAGNQVNVVDLDSKALDKSKAVITKSLERVAKNRFKNDPGQASSYPASVLGKITFSSDMASIKGSELILEAIVEDLPTKQKLFKEVEKFANPTAILASNTSSLPIGDIAKYSGRKERFLGLHFFNPVPVMKLLEVVKTKESSEEAFLKLVNWGNSIGKVTIACKDVPGFVVNRLLIPFLVEAVEMYERGDASIADIDTAMKLGAGYPMGPFELADYVGLDVLVFVLRGWIKTYPDNPSFRLPKALEKLVAEGKLGVKSGAGFYNYDKKSK